MKFEALAKSFAPATKPHSEVEFTGEIPVADIALYEGRALTHLSGELELPGFRKGHVPADIARKRLGDIAILEEAVELFMRDFYPELVEVHKLDVVGRPEIRITKLAPGNPVGITIRSALYPEIVLPKGWKELGAKTPAEAAPTVEEGELTEALTSIRRAHAKAQTPGADPQAEVKEEDLPPLDNTFAQSLGNFTDLADLKAKLQENMLAEKAQKAKEARRGKIVEELLANTTVDVPRIFVESELEKIMGQMREDVSRFGLTFEEYLKRVQKSEEDIRGEFRDQAEKRAKLQLTLNKIAEEEKLVPDEAQVQSEMKHALEHFPDARPDLVQIHIETVLRNEKALQLLEGEAPRATTE